MGSNFCNCDKPIDETEELCPVCTADRINACPEAGVQEMITYLRQCIDGFNGYTALAAMAKILIEDLKCVAKDLLYSQLDNEPSPEVTEFVWNGLIARITDAACAKHASALQNWVKENSSR